MINLNTLLKKGYSIEQANQILKSDDDIKNYLLKLNSNIPEEIFRKIRVLNIKSNELIENLNKFDLQRLEKIKNDNLFFKTFAEYNLINGKNIIFINPFNIEPTNFIGLSGIGKSFKKIL